MSRHLKTTLWGAALIIVALGLIGCNQNKSSMNSNHPAVGYGHSPQQRMFKPMPRKPMQPRIQYLEV